MSGDHSHLGGWASPEPCGCPHGPRGEYIGIVARGEQFVSLPWAPGPLLLRRATPQFSSSWEVAGLMQEKQEQVLEGQSRCRPSS